MDERYSGRFHLHFGRESDARAVADALASDLIPALMRLQADWLVIIRAESVTDEEFDALQNRLKRLAADNAGRYEGFEGNGR